jgi:Uncharacterized protein conserved in bacteria (DUF2252)
MKCTLRELLWITSDPEIEPLPQDGLPVLHDVREISGYLGSGNGFADALAEFGRRYADQTEKDWAELKRARK